MENRRDVQLLKLLLWILIAAWAYEGAVEWEHYRRTFAWQRQGLNAWDYLVLHSLLCGKTLILFVPVLFTSATLIFLGKPLLAQRITYGTGFLVYFWLTMDIQTQAVTGQNIVEYFKYILPNGAEWAGGMGWIIKHFVLTAARTFLAVVVCVIATQLVINLWSRISTSAMTRMVLFGSAVAYCAGIFGPPWAQLSFSKRHLLGQLYTVLPINISRVSGFETESSEKFAAIFREKIQSVLSSHRSNLLSPRRADDTVVIQGSQLPNVIMIVLESFRQDSLNSDWMPRLDRWARGGVKFTNHYSGGNASEMGWFALLYGRSALIFDLALNAKVKPQAAVTLGRSGYHLTYISSMAHADWRRMGEFINKQTFDDVIIDHSANDIPSGDRLVLHRVDQILKQRPDQSQFVAVLLGSTHYPYLYPRDQEIHTPVVSEDANVLKLNAVKHRNGLLNRYRNAASFLDKELATLLESLDPQKNLIIVTGDHGESLFDDGVLSHSTRLSDIQTRTPLVMVGPGVPKNVVEQRMTIHSDILPTILHALAGRPIPIAGNHGVDLLEPSTLARRSSLLLTHHTKTEPYRVVLLQADGRLRLNLSLSQNVMKMVGLVDERDKLMFPLLPKPQDASIWAESFNEQIRTLAR